MRRAPKPEYSLQVSVVEHLEARRKPGVYFCAIPNEGRRSAAVGAQMRRAGLRAGAPDLIVLCNGICHGLELKAGKNDLTMSQVATRDAWRAAGGVYEVARSLDEALAYLTQWDAIKSNVLHIGTREVPFG